MPKPSDEILVAYLDGELDAAHPEPRSINRSSATRACARG